MRTLIDCFGRTLTETQPGYWEADGAVVDWSGQSKTDAEVLLTFAGLAPDGWVPPVPVPATVTNRQLRLVLIQMGLFDQADAFIRAEGQLAITEWDYANEFDRHHPIVVAAAAGFNLTEEQVDDAFRLAATL